MHKESKSLVWGIILIIIGFLFLGNNLGWFYFEWQNFWPLLMILGGILFWLFWFTQKKEVGLLMPGTILISYGVLFLICTLESWRWMDELWPIFLLGPGLGFLFMYLLGTREKGLLIPAFILVFLAVLFWSDYFYFSYLWPLLLIGIGVLLLLKSRRTSKTVENRVKDINSSVESSE